ncbi:hypothetical protein BKG93_07865 [Rodentibacter ratti]|uniref:Anti-CBASS protein Acb1-like N-terminal domain-containing protein n=1 Tax=Rodentibacter ratti TaxID=1906745 RepID=A0A1V3L3B7_9PAST|nr:anti-CBASS Acb1 family protein [Rodentibacter ratti]OOF84437.1 hypothetical protein BKG93_07865 [Rodentibacter ratti]
MKIDDNLQSLALKLGVKQESASYVRTQTITEDREQLNALWVGNWVARKICIKRPQDMVRRWRDVYSNDLGAEKLEAFENLERKLKLRETLGEALSWSSLYGSVAILIVTDTMALNTPLQPTEQINRLVILPKWKISPSGERDEDVLSPNFSGYSSYQINGSLSVHYSRLIILNAAKSPLSDDDIWGISDLEAVISTLKRFDGASTNIGDLIYESKIDIFKIAGLSDKISSGLEGDVARVISSVQSIKSATNSLLLDPENEYEQKELSFGGLKDLLVEFRNAVAGAADMPVTILFGQSAAGFASGQEDIDNYHESVHRLQEERLRPVLERLDPLLCNMAFGHYPQDWWFEFVPLKELSQEQQINMLNTFATASNVFIQNGILNETQVANELKESGLFANISAEDIEDMKNVDKFAGDFEESEEMEGTEIQAGQE